MKNVIASIVLTLAASAHGAWINEIHYSNTGTDVGEFVEVVIEPGDSPASLGLELYNGTNGEEYRTVSLGVSGPTSDYRYLVVDISGLQNGPADGIALRGSGDVVLEFISYEGAFTATNGSASGMTSVDIGVSQSDSEAIGSSLGLTGSGSKPGDFTWVKFANNTRGAVNAGQAIVIPEPASIALLGLLGVATLRRRIA